MLSADELRAELAAARVKLADITRERDEIKRAYRQLMEQFELLRRRLFVAKAERVDSTQLELEFEKTKRKLAELTAQLGGQPSESGTAESSTAPEPKASSEPGSRPSGKPPGNSKGNADKKPLGRRNLSEMTHLPERRIEIRDAALEATGAFIGWEESFKYGYQRPGPVRVVIARAKYKIDVDLAQATSAPCATLEVVQVTRRSTILTAEMPRLLIRRGLLAPSLLARIIVQKLRFGLPFFRQEKQFASDGIELDRGTMARSVEDVGASLGPIVLACADEARKTAFCLATDATGVAIQPEPLADGRRQPCRRGHFFVVLADKKHVFFEYQAKHTSAAVCDMFRGFSGYIQADAHAIYDALFRGDAVAEEAEPPTEVACWAHARRRFWEAAVSGFAVAREGLLRIRHLYQLDQSWSELPPSSRLEKRRGVLKPLVAEFFEWVRAQNDLSSTERGLVRKALGYAIRQEAALCRFLADGRLRMDNNPSENALRIISTGRKAWLFFGSDDHAEAAANLFSLIASCQLHGIDPELYLTELIRVMPYWPRQRYLELAPAYWTQTRARLDPRQLAAELGPLTVPPPVMDSASEQPATN